MKFNKNEFGWKEKVSVNTDELVTKNDIPHYNEILMFEISGEDFGYFMNNNYFNMSALNIDETKSYIGKTKTNINSDEEFICRFVYDKTNNALMDENSQTYIYNHKSYNGENFVEDTNSAVITLGITPMDIGFAEEGYFKLYEVDKVELDNNCLSDNVIIANSLTVGERIGDIGLYSVAEGGGTTASGAGSHSEGSGTTASGEYSHAEGGGTEASGEDSHAEGNGTIANGDYSHAEGGSTTARGYYSHAEGNNTTASGESSHAEGYYTEANGNYSHAEGVASVASGEGSHVEGTGSMASGNYSHAENYAIAEGDNSHAEGYWTYASSANQHVQGKFNIKDTTGTYAHIVGNGTANNARSNAHTLDWQGNGWYKGKLSQDGIPTEDKDLATKKYVDDKTEILPVKGNYTIFEDAVPSRTEVASNGLEYYIFDSLQNEDMIISAVKYNLNVTFNDGTNDRTMDLIIERSLKDSVFCEKDGFAVEVSYSETNHAIEMVLINANDYTQYSILKATLNCDSYSNLLQDYHIENINYDKIKEVPTALNRIANYKNFTLKGKEYYDLYDNLSIWDANKFNERLDENSGVKRNEFFKLLGKDKYTMRIKQKDSEGIGFGQHISIDNSKNVHIVADAGVDVIIKIYNSTTKELINTLNYCEAGFYKTRIINKDYLNGVTSIFIAFTVKDSTESFYGNTYVNDLIVHYDSSFLVKEEILTKTNTKEYTPTSDYHPATKKYVDDSIASQPQISFDTEGNLVVTIGGVTKKFKEITE